ncbi:helix-turn-helix domain-containing protein [Roseovarius sp. SYSU LYC5161]|uniref:helix-turn-helix domain-containing protein n=1 Tax=Roseovarius halophilus (ex Wu et al. 2025) TaxID=3376060 RepID=UPI00399A14DB
MSESSIVGTRIRERRLSSGLRQSELAHRVGISPSYLNLIEHNRRRIGGKTLLKLADALDVEPGILSDGAEATLIANLREAAVESADPPPELDRVEEFAGRFPGWANLAATLHQHCESLEETVATLTDRMAHDPYLAASLHEVISTVTSIWSTASILVETDELEPEWQNRFHRNINEDSSRLADGAESLVRYLERAPDTEADIKWPQAEVHDFLAAKGYHIAALEAGAGAATVDLVVDSAEALSSDTARALARHILMQYLEDARRLPLQDMMDAIARHGMAPDRLARALDVDLPLVFRRLATLPEEDVGPVGLITCDGSGALTFRKPVQGFEVPRISGACPLWPLFQVLGQPNAPIEAVLHQAGRGGESVRAYALAERLTPASFTQPPLLRGNMLVVPDTSDSGGAAPREVGVNCPICPVEECPARREPPVISKGF